MRTDIPSAQELTTSAGFCRFYIVTIDAQSVRELMSGGTGFLHLMIGTNNHRMTAQALGVVGGAGQLMTVGANVRDSNRFAWGMHGMAAGAGQKHAVVTVLGRLDEVGVLLMVRLRMDCVLPHVTCRSIIAAGVISQIVRAAGSRFHHLVTLVKGRISFSAERIVPLGTGMTLAADHGFP